jgi:hypothetical protein
MGILRAGGLAVLGAALAVCGCTSSQGMIGAASLSPEARDLVGRAVLPPPIRREVIGRDTRVTSILVVPTFAGPSLERALADALSKGEGDVLVNVRVKTTGFWFLVGWSMLEVRGDVVDTRTLGGPR